MKHRVLRTAAATTTKSITVGTFALAIMLGALCQAQTQNAKAPYPTMAPLEQYLIADRDAEIALARSAAPESISGDAEVLVLRRHGYETAIKGKNGFVCFVQRSWAAAPDDPEFWNPKLRAPICINAPAARSFLPLINKKTEWVLAGRSKAQILEDLQTAFDKKDLPTLEPGRDELYAVKARKPERYRRALASTRNVFRSASRSSHLGRKSEGLPDAGSGGACGADDNIYDSSSQVVGRHAR